MIKIVSNIIKRVRGPIYCNQGYFNFMAVSTARCSVMLNEPIRDIVNFARASNVHGRYEHEDIYEEITIAALLVKEFVETEAPPPNSLVPLLEIEYCIKHFHTNGRKISKWIPRGEVFVARVEPLHNKVPQCLYDVQIYRKLRLDGIIPLTSVFVRYIVRESGVSPEREKQILQQVRKKTGL